MTEHFSATADSASNNCYIIESENAFKAALNVYMLYTCFYTFEFVLILQLIL